MKWFDKFCSQLKQLICGNNGFTLVEAIVTVAIAGVIVVPISIIFQGVLLDTVETKDQLKATQLAQQYTEAFRVMPYYELETISNTSVLDDTFLSGYDLPELPDSMELQMDMIYNSADAEFSPEFGDEAEADTSVSSFNHPYQLATFNEIQVDYDVLLYMPILDNNRVLLFDDDDDFAGRDFSATFSKKFPDNGGPSGDSDSDKTLRVTYSPALGGTTQVTVDFISTSSDDWTKNYTTTSNIVAVFCDADDQIDDGSVAATNVEIINNTADVIQVYVYRSSADKINPTVTIVDGHGVSFNDQQSINMFTHRLFELEVRIVKDGETLAEVVTTIIAK